MPETKHNLAKSTGTQSVVPDCLRSNLQPLRAVLPSAFRPLIVRDNLRYGNPADGGYIVPQRALAASKAAICFGINLDWGFETDIVSRFDSLMLFSYDKTTTLWRTIWWAITRFLAFPITGRPKHLCALTLPMSYLRFVCHRRIHHRQVFLAKTRGPSEVTFHEVCVGGTVDLPCFVKIDIEGNEYAVLPQLARYQGDLTAIAVEFHDCHDRMGDIKEIVTSLTDFAVTHVHANNFGGVDPSTEYPRILEVTLVRRDILSDEPKFDGDCYYLACDAPNVSNEPEILIRFCE